MSKKSIFLIAIISILTLVLAACGSNNAAPEKNQIIPLINQFILLKLKIY